MATGLLIAIAGMMFVPLASSQLTIHVGSRYRTRHHVYYHPRREYYHPRHVVYYHRRVVYHHPHEGVRLRLNVR